MRLSWVCIGALLSGLLHAVFSELVCGQGKACGSRLFGK